MERIKRYFVFSAIWLLVGCGGGSSDNHAPVAESKMVTIREDSSTNITLSGSDEDGDALTFSYTQPAHGTVRGVAPDLIYTPSSNFNGKDSFTYTVNDGKVDSAQATMTIAVTAVNDAPVAHDQSISVGKNSAVNITLDGEDAESDTLTYSYTDPSHGTLSGTAPNLKYTPDTNYAGNDSFTYQLNDGRANSNTATVSISIQSAVTVSGTITYDYVPGVSVGSSNQCKLDYNAIVQKPARNVIVQMLDGTGAVIATTETDANGSYRFDGVASNMQVKIRVLAKMHRTGTPAWDVKVVDNTNSDALYVMDGTLASVGTSDSTRDLNAPSGWGGSSYTGRRAAAPFAILDDIYAAMQTVLSADTQTVFPPLQVNWSVNNVALSGDTARGEIGTSIYTDGNLFILGDADSDTDEYDNHIIAHEWGHYYEDKFSRSDSIGGSHGGRDLLDIRVAFSEGWGNAFSAIALKDPLYCDTSVPGEATGWSMNIENETPDNPGWFSEGSVQRIIYDLWDSTNESENGDTLLLGFGPIHTVLVNAEKTAPAFTSLFTFIKALKDLRPSDSTAIDNIVAHESIATIDDIYGGLESGSTSRTNHAGDYPYAELTDGSAGVQVHTTNQHGSFNKLGNRIYVKFKVDADRTYTVKVQQTNGSDADPDFYVYKMPDGIIAQGRNGNAGSESRSVALNAGENYLMEIWDFNNTARADFNVTVQ